MANKQEQVIYKQVVDQQQYCQLCGSGAMLEIHHIRYGSCGRKTYIGNLIVLCKTCHMKVHSNKKKWQTILIEKVDEYDKQ